MLIFYITNILTLFYKNQWHNLLYITLQIKIPFDLPAIQPALKSATPYAMCAKRLTQSYCPQHNEKHKKHITGFR
jgi:hypothetical protein